MKLAPVYRAFDRCESAEITQMIINTGQHYDAEMSRDFIEELELNIPDYNLNVHTKTQAEFVGKSMVDIDSILSRYLTDLVIVYGDTNSTLAGALVSAKMNIPLAHVEAGLREFDMSIPEEVNKRAVDAISDLLFAPSQRGTDQLLSEQVSGEVHFVGDVTYDLINNLESQIDQTFTRVKEEYNLEDDYLLFTCHRAVNTDNRQNLESIIHAIDQIDEQILFPIHPRTANAIRAYGLDKLLQKANIINLSPLPYLETQALLKHCRCCITDSGGLIKEAFYHRVPAIIIDNQTEWIETVESGLHTITGPNEDKITSAIQQVVDVTISENFYGDGNASRAIVEMTLKYLSNRKETA